MVYMNTAAETSKNASSTNVEPQPVPQEPSSSKAMPLPSIGQLFSQSFERFKGGALNALLLTLLYSLAGGIIFALAVGLFVGQTASALPLTEVPTILKNQGLGEIITRLGPNLGIALGSTFALLLIGTTILGSVYSGALVYAFAWAENKPSLGQLISGAFSKFGWLILANVLGGLLIFGGLWLLLIPGLILSIFLSFTLFELLLENKKPVAAMQASVNLVSANFGALAGRWLLFLIGYMLLSGITSTLSRNTPIEINGIFSLLNMIISYAGGWFTMAYSVTLYMHAKAATPEGINKKGLLVSFTIMSVLGWIIFIIGTIVVTTFVRTNLPKWQNELMNGSSINPQEISEFEGLSENIATTPVQTSCDLQVGIPQNVGKDGRYWIYEERSVDAAAFRGLAPAAQLANGVQAGYLSYKHNEERLINGEKEGVYNVGFPGLRLYCVDNTQQLTLADFVEQATAVERYTVTTLDSQRSMGELLVQPVMIAGLTNGDFYNERGYLAVTPGPDSKLLFIMSIGADTEDADMFDIYVQLEAAENALRTE